MNANRVKLYVIAIIVFPLLVIAGFKPDQVGAVAADDVATTYKTKCAACHSPAAAKFFDPAKTDEEHVQTILKGKKGEKPPYMPAFEEKGITADQAKELAAYMKQLRTPAQ
jgi:mono/diheme cytochrome c family protein